MQANERYCGRQRTLELAAPSRARHASAQMVKAARDNSGSTAKAAGHAEGAQAGRSHGRTRASGPTLSPWPSSRARSSPSR